MPVFQTTGLIGILCGLESEAKIARRIPNTRVACAAARPGKARALAQELVAQGVTSLISFGVAGGLQPGLAVGSLIIGTHVTSDKGTWACDATLSNALADKARNAQRGGVWGSETLVPTAADKAALHRISGCVIVDMESQCAAEIAATANLPLAVVRAVCDTSDMHVPPVVMAAIGEDGQVKVGRAISSLLCRPAQIPDLFHVARGIHKSLNVLKAHRAIF